MGSHSPCLKRHIKNTTIVRRLALNGYHYDHNIIIIIHFYIGQVGLF